MRVICTNCVFLGFVMGCLGERICLWRVPLAAGAQLTIPGITLQTTQHPNTVMLGGYNRDMRPLLSVLITSAAKMGMRML